VLPLGEGLELVEELDDICLNGSERAARPGPGEPSQRCISSMLTPSGAAT